jgi:hypothetical protein
MSYLFLFLFLFCFFCTSASSPAHLHKISHPQQEYKTVVAKGLPVTFSVAIHEPRTDVFVSAAIAGGKIWDPSVVRILIAALKHTPHGTFVDCGANIGYFTLIAARMGHSVVAFEAARDSADRLAFSLEENELQHAVILYQNGVADRNGTGYLQKNAQNQVITVIPNV